MDKKLQKVQNSKRKVIIHPHTKALRKGAPIGNHKNLFKKWIIEKKNVQDMPNPSIP